MDQLRWEDVGESEIRGEIEAVLESSGQSKHIRSFLNSNSEVIMWREMITGLCDKLVEQYGIENLTPDIIYGKVFEEARKQIPHGAYEQVEEKISKFLKNEFEKFI